MLAAVAGKYCVDCSRVLVRFLVGAWLRHGSMVSRSSLREVTFPAVDLSSRRSAAVGLEKAGKLVEGAVGMMGHQTA